MVNPKQIFCILLFPALALAMSDKDLMLQARTEYKDGNFKKAISIYSKISPQSDFWLESIEERAWGWTRLNEYENALADLQSLTSPVWSSQVGPESYMLSTFVSLQMCNYKEVLNKMNLFKKRMLVRVDALEKIADRPMTKEFKDLIPSILDSKISLAHLGNTAELYPRYFFRDTELLKNLKDQKTSLAADRLKQLAQNDLKEIQTNLKKMKIIEVEMMQTVLMNDKSQQTNKKLEFSQVDRKQQIMFPVKDDEVWVDEVGQFQVRAQKCASQKGASL